MAEQAVDTYKGPFWRSNGAIFIVIKSLAQAEQLRSANWEKLEQGEDEQSP